MSRTTSPRLDPLTPVPTPRATKLNAKMPARTANTHFAWVRSRMKNIVSSALDACLRSGLGSGLRAGVFSAAGFLSRRAGAGVAVSSAAGASGSETACVGCSSATRCAVRAFDRGRLPRFAEARAIPDLLSSTA